MIFIYIYNIFFQGGDVTTESLQVILLPWTYWLIKAILFPRPSAELDFESGGSAPDGSQVRLCKTSFMEV
jgi:hypothetical protein